MTGLDDFHGHPSKPEDFSFTQSRSGRDGFFILIKSHYAYDSRWPFWRRWWANLRGRP